MSNPKIESLVTIAILIARQSPDLPHFVIAKYLLKLKTIAASLRKRYEANRSYQRADTDSYCRRTENLEKQAEKVARELKINIEFQRDPRGWPIKLKIGNVTKSLL